MTISYILAAEPVWYIVDLDGLAAGGAQLFTYDSLTRLPRATFQDAGGTQANTNPIIFDLNGTNAPIYWQIDTSDPNGYYIEVYNAAGTLLWEQDNFPSGGSGGGTVNTFIPLKSYIANNQFIDHIGATASPIASTNLVIAPSNHKGFTPAQIPVVSTYGVVGPDIRFIANTASVPPTDQITFPLFSLSGSQLTNDVTPVDYIRYQCTGAGTGETYKDFQFPITQKVKNLSNQSMTFTLWASVTSTPVIINIYSRQYYGSGTSATAESTSTRVLQDSYTLSSSWTKFTTNFTMPNVSGNSIGTPGLQTDDDAIYMEIEMPLNQTCDVLFTKPCLYLGSISPGEEFDDYDQIDSINLTPRTGDIKTSLFPTAPNGWLNMNDLTIGNVGSGATSRANADTFQLYKTLWDGVLNTWAPVSTGRGASAVADFLAGKTIQLPRSLGRALAGSGVGGSGVTNTVLGEYKGVESVTLLSGNLPTGTPINASASGDFTAAGGVATHVPGSVGAYGQGSATPVSVIQPTSFFNVFIKL